MPAFRPAKPCPITQPLAEEVEFCLEPVTDCRECAPVSAPQVPCEQAMGPMKILQSLLAMCYLP